MIRINLAKRKAPSFVEGTVTKSKGMDLATSLKRFDVGSLKEFPIRKLVITTAAIVLGSTLLDDFKTSEIKKVDTSIAAVRAKQTKLSAELAKSAGYEKIRDQLEKDAFVLKSKVEALRKLRDGRDDSPKAMVVLSQGIPNEVWLESYTLRSGQLDVKGFSVDYNQISDLMRKLGESPYYSNLELEESSQKKDDKTSAFTHFSIKGNRTVATLGGGSGHN
jgi:Tfp pilus assembly protein PilN